MLVVFCKGNDFRVLLEDDRKVIETNDVKFCEGDRVAPDAAGENNEVIHFDMSNEIIISDDRRTE